MRCRLTSLSICLVVLVASISWCSNPDKEAAWEIIKTPQEQRGQALSKLSPEKQVDVFVYADTKIEPPVILAGEVASNWKSTLPVIKQRLVSETDGGTLAGMMMILSAVSAQYCSLSGREDVLSVASQAVDKIDAPYRDLAKKQLREITHPQNQLSRCQ
jgi:hypothetical protein